MLKQANNRLKSVYTGRIHSIGSRTRDRFGQPVAISIPVLQKRRRSIHGSIFHSVGVGWGADVLNGIGLRTDDDHRRPRCI